MPRSSSKSWDGLSLTYVTLDVGVDPVSGPEALRAHIERALAEHGTPVRWAVVATGKSENKCRVDAVVSVDRELDPVTTEA